MLPLCHSCDKTMKECYMYLTIASSIQDISCRIQPNGLVVQLALEGIGVALSLFGLVQASMYL